MTNGDMIKILFPQLTFFESNVTVSNYEDVMIECSEWDIYFEREWWNSPYMQKESIGLLKQEPCEDTISKETVLNVILEDEYIQHHMSGDVWERIEDLIRDLPSVQPEQRTGHWEYKSYLEYNCSACGSFNERESNYCPECGAKME